MLKNGKYFLGLLLVSMLSVCIVGCGESATQDSPEAESAIVEEAPVSIEEESSVEEAKLTPEDWIASLNLEEPVFAIWNDVTGEHTVLENDATYQLKENDRVLWCIEADKVTTGLSEDDELVLPNTIVKRGADNIRMNYDKYTSEYNGTYIELFFEATLKETVIIESDNFKNSITVLGIDAGNKPQSLEEVDFASTLAGKEWFEAIGNQIEEPFVVMWNDDEGIKVLCEEWETGAKYEAKEGNVFGIYMPQIMLQGLVWGIPYVDERVDNGVLIIDIPYNEYPDDFMNGETLMHAMWMHSKDQELNVGKSYKIVIP